MGTFFAMIGIFLVALSPLVLGALVVRAVRWATGGGGRHRRGAPPRPRADLADEPRSGNQP